MYDVFGRLPCAPASLNGACGFCDVCRVFMLNVCSMFKFLHGAFAGLVQHLQCCLDACFTQVPVFAISVCMAFIEGFEAFNFVDCFVCPGSCWSPDECLMKYCFDLESVC